MSIVETIAAAVKPWNELYSHSKVVAGGVTYVHVASLLLGGGFAVASDRAVLLARRADLETRRYLLRDFSTVHKPVVAFLGLMVVSGLALMLADVETFLVSKVYWTKMVLFVLLLANGYLVTRTEQALAADPSPSNPLWGRFTVSAVTSLTLWLATTLAGVVLVNS
jgi:hypothetical protein